MKRTFTLILFFLITLSSKGQNYQINFTGSGETAVVDSVYVENLTQGTTLGIKGTETLNLVGTLSVFNYPEMIRDFKIYPNPMQQTSRIDFFTEQADDVILNVYNVSGKLISTYTDKVYPGSNTFEISGFPAGFYIVNIKTNNWQKTSRFISEGIALSTPKIKSINEQEYKNKSTPIIKSNATIQMQYNDGDMLLLEGISDDYVNNFTIVPTESQTINLEFYGCSDADGNNYATVNIGNQIWMAENLNYETGTSWCYDNDDANCDVYGRLYDWQTALTVCPSGWHLPSDAEWTELIDHLGGTSIAGGKMKSVTGWFPPNVEASNSSGFSGLPGGTGFYNYSFDVEYYAHFWSSTEHTSDRAWERYIYFGNDDAKRHHANKTSGLSCRCIKD